MDLGLIIEEFILNYGLISIFIVVALEYANAPLPSEIVLPFAGILALEYNMNLGLIILVSVLGGLFGSLTNYYIGYKLGNPLIYKIKTKYPKTQKAVKESYRWMNKYEKSSVMYSRLVPLARTFISIIAGVTRMKISWFIIYSSIGITIWNTFLIIIGYIVGDNMDKITQILSTYSKGLIILILIGAISFYIYKNKKNNKDTVSYNRKYRKG